MVERLKIAVEKARALRAQNALSNRTAGKDLFSIMRSQGDSDEDQTPDLNIPINVLEQEITDPDRTSAWNALTSVEPNVRALERSRIISYAKTDPAHGAFDVLRTRMQSTLSRNGWTRVGVTSPTSGCGKTFVAANLAFSLARQQSCHTLLMDMDMRKPSLGKVLGMQHPDSLRWFLTGEIPTEKFLRRIGSNLALGLNSGRLQDAAELIQAPSTTHALNRMISNLAPSAVIYDLPPMLSCDDVMGFLPQLDCVIVVIGGGLTKPAEVTECENLLKDQCPILGMILNRAEDAKSEKYQY